MCRDFTDSREGFDAAEYDYYMGDYTQEDNWDDEDEQWLEDELERVRDYMLEQQEREDYDETDESYGYYGECEDGGYYDGGYE